MSALDTLTDEQFKQHALQVLQRELGLDGMARFLRIYRSGHGDYTAERHSWLAGVTLEQVLPDLSR